ncbi:MAG: DUF4340 domain-containing protein [Nitrospiraceae bacterium]|nr:MAG: DUF4340 domain-containing protein [Nitrospiraceae bacterium]
MAEAKSAMKFKGTFVLLIAALVTGAFYIFYILPAENERKIKEELLKRFFRVDELQVEFLRIKNPHGTFQLSRGEKRWTLTSPTVLPADSKTLDRIFRIIIKGEILKVITSDISRAAEFELDKPRAVLAIGYRGIIDELVIGGMTPSMSGYYAFVKGINAIFLVDEDIAQIRTIGLYDLRSKSLFDFDPDSITDIEIVKKEEEIVLGKNKDIWKVYHPFSGRASTDDIMDFLFGIRNQRADEFYDGQVPDARNYRDTITLKLSSRENEAYLIDVHFWGTGYNEGAVAYQKGMKYAGRLPRDFWNFVNRQATDFRYRDLFHFAEEDVWKIDIKKEEHAYELVRRGDDWFIGQETVDAKKLKDFVWFLKAWKSERLLSHSASFSRDDPAYEISIIDKNGSSLGTLRIYDKIKGESLGFTQEGEEQFLYYAVSDNLDDICTVTTLDIRKIQDREDLIP